MTQSLERAPGYDYGPMLMPQDGPGSFTMWRYRRLLPVPDSPVLYPLPVGGTPLLPAPALRQASDAPRLWVKDETRNPTASNKDRATALVIEGGLRRGIGTITTASTGNAAVSTAFGAAAAGLRAVIFVSADCEPGKLALMTQAGARVFRVADGYAAAVDLSRAAARAFGWLDRNTGANPITLEAKKTVAFEVWEQLGPPDAGRDDRARRRRPHPGGARQGVRRAGQPAVLPSGNPAWWVSRPTAVSRWCGPGRAHPATPAGAGSRRDGRGRHRRAAPGDRRRRARRGARERRRAGGGLGTRPAGRGGVAGRLAGVGAEPAGAAALAGLEVAVGAAWWTGWRPWCCWSPAARSRRRARRTAGARWPSRQPWTTWSGNWRAADHTAPTHAAHGSAR